MRLGGAAPYTIGNGVTVSWTASGVSQNLKLQLIRSGGGLVGPIVNSLAAGTTSYSWTAGHYIGGTAVPGEENSYKIRVSTLDDSLAADSPAFSLVAAGVPGTPGAITVTQPTSGTSWRPGSRQTITWTKSGDMPHMVQLTLRREGAPETEDPVVRIADGCANNGSRVWFVPDDLAAGRYFVRVRASAAIRGDSAVFTIDAEGERSALPGPDTPIRADLEIPGVGIEYYNGHVVAWVKNNGPDSMRDHDVKFRLNFPERGGGEQIITKRITVAVGAEKGIELLAMAAGDIPDAGLRTIVGVDAALSHIVDANRLNQHRDVRLYADNRTPIDLAIAISDQRVSHVLAGGDLHEGIPHHKYRLYATLHLRNNSGAPAEITRVSCRWKEQYHTDGGWTHNPEVHAHGTLTLGPFRPGEDIRREIELEYKTYTFQCERRIHFELDPDRLLNDPNRGNNEANSVTYDIP